MARHDTESGHLTLVAGLGILGFGTAIAQWIPISWNRRRVAFALIGSWAMPAIALMVSLVVSDPTEHAWSAWLVERCRFAEIPTSDLERLAVWAREKTPESSRFIGPPGPKTFRYWSRRDLAFNRAGSPYHAEGLADWSSRFRDHVGFTGTSADFARAYLADRHALEARYDRMTPLELQAIARRQGATHVLASSRLPSDPNRPLELLRADGRYAIYRVAVDR